MFQSFFPKPKLFFISSAVWSLLAVLVWYAGGRDIGAYFGLPPLPPGQEPIIGVSVFWTAPFLWFYLYYAVVVAIFAGFWFAYSPHRWQYWSVLGSALIIFNTYFSVQVSVAFNAWYGPFYDMRFVRQACAEAETKGQGWQSAMNGLRRRARSLWQSLSAQEKRQFNRHLRAIYDSHRNRLPAAVHARLQQELADGRTVLRRGRAGRRLPEGVMRGTTE